MAGQKDSSFLESFGRVIGQLPMGIKSPLMEKTIELQLAKEKRQLDEQLARQQMAFDQVVELERLKGLATDWQNDYGNKPEAEGLHGPIPEFGTADQLRLYQQYGQAGLDPEKIAEAQRAELATDAFRRGLANITNDAALVNIGMGKEYKPVELEGGVFYNPYDIQNFNLGSTKKHQAETKIKKAELEEQNLRMDLVRTLGSDIMKLNALNKRELGKPIEAEVEGPDGKTHKALITQDVSGGYHYGVPTHEVTGEPMVIPPEAAGEGLTSEQKNIKNRAKLLGISEVEALQTLNNRSQYSDLGFIESRLIENAKGVYGNRNSDKKILTATFDDFVRARYGSYFPDYFEDEIKRSKTMTDKEKEELIADIDAYNQKVFEMQLVGQPPQPQVTHAVQPTVVQPPAAPIAPVIAPTTVAPPTIQPPPTMPLPDLAMVTPPPPVPPPTPIPEQPPAPDFMAFAETVMTNNSPAEINAALKKQGFDLSSQAMGAMAIDAINQGVSVQDIQQLYQLLGIQWSPPA